MDYLGRAQRVGEWLLNTAERGIDGWSWPVQPGVSPDVSPGLGWGTAAPTLFFIEAYRTDGDERWLDAARQGARWMNAYLPESIEGWAGCGLFTGVGGWAFVLDQLADAKGDDAARAQAATVIEAIAQRFEDEGDGVHWHGLTEILWGTAGIGCLMLATGRRHIGDRALDLASRAGSWLLSKAEPAERGGIRWSLGPGFQRPNFDRRFPNFAHGTAGIAFFLARLADETGERRFLDGALAGAEWIFTTTRTDGDTCAAFHHEPDATDNYTLGWCHGPPGLGWLFRQLELTSGDPSWREWTRRAARAVRTSGIPEQREPGFWDNVARCCGSAGVAEFFLDLHRLEGVDDSVAFARTMVDDLLGRAIEDDQGLRWSNYEFRNEEPNLPPSTNYLQGAPGIGSTLLRMHRHLGGDSWTVPWPHAPRWDPADLAG